MPPDFAHSMARLALSLPSPGPILDERLEVELAGIKLRNPVGLAAGYDKDGKLYWSFSRWGMGFYVLGSVTALRRRPLPKPRLYRPRTGGGIWMLNAFGLPSEGVIQVSRRIGGLGPSLRVPIVASLAGFSLDEFSVLIRAADALPQVSALELNISCPLFDDPAGMEELARLSSRMTRKPSLIKLSPRHAGVLEEAAGIAEDYGLGISVYNTIPVRSSALGAGRGGMSGLPLYRMTLSALARIRGVSDKIPLVAVGGIVTGTQVLEALEAGADAVQSLTAVAFRGPMAFRLMSEELLAALRERGYSSASEARGSRSRAREVLSVA
ncbi:MAG: dihydroorotate dehydrogenase [Conexivisphaera sp.]